MSDKPFSAEPIVIVRLAQPRCALTHGQAPCAASGAACFNTFSTCGDPTNHTPGATLDLYFGMPGQGRPSNDLMILPLLAGWPDTSPVRVNVAGSDRRVNPLGISASARIAFRDAPHSDFLVDPYRETRGYDPLTRGTFWSKWLARNTYGKAGMRVTIFEGFAGQSLAQMTSRLYLADALDMNGEEGVTLKCLDVLSKAVEEKAQVPPVSPGALVADLPASETGSFLISGAVLADYPATGTLRINNEVLTYSGITETAQGTLEVTIAARATDGTEIADHDAEDRVQECFRFTDAPVDQGLAALYAATTIPPEFLPLSDWATEAATFLSAYRLNGLVTEPTAVRDLVGEVLEQSQALQFWDEEAKLVRFVAVKPLTDPPALLDERVNFIAGSVRVRDFPDRRVSRVYVFFDPRDPTESRTREENYRQVQGSLDLPLEDEKAFGDKAIRKVFARFINSGPVALETTSRILARYKQGAREITFAVSDKDGGHQVGDVVQITLRRVQDTTGAPRRGLWIITSREVRARDRQVIYTVEDAALAGQLLRIAADDVPPYQGDGSDPFGVAWISDANGLLPNGDPGFTIQ